jgi:uncharacterized protein YbbC (DUF1343 family)
LTVRTGLELLLDQGLYRAEAIGLITNHTGVGPDLRRNVELLLQRGYKVGALFSPEHGIYGSRPDGEPVQGEKDPSTGIPVYSLYGEDRAPSGEMLRGLDVLIFDIQDIGARYYTYPTTMLLSMEAAAQSGAAFAVLDRPNPLGGVSVAGNVASPDRLSFVCGAPVAIRHGLTLGELALMVAAEKSLPRPEVLRAEGWRRSMYFQDTGLPWVPPSPNAPTMDMAVLYPGTCLIEGTNLSEGRGTSLPFQVTGAPWVNEDRLVSRLRDKGLPGVMVRATRFQPSAGKWAGETCGGVQFHVRDQREVRPVELGVKLLFALRDLHPDRFALREPREAGEYALDLLAAGPELRQALAGEDSPKRLLAKWEDEARSFETRRSEYLLYG